MMILLLLLCAFAATFAAAEEAAIRVFPQRTSTEAAVVEWGHSAIINALDGVVATFGPQTSDGATFEVETTPILAKPIDGLGTKQRSNDEDEYPGKLDNADEVDGNMVIMTDVAGFSGVTMARIAKESGAAALMIVNTDKEGDGDFIYSLEPENEEEERYAEEHIDIPVIMVSLQAGNIITTALATDDMDPALVNSGGALPERVRLYAGGDRPFFEDAVSKSPVVYLIHNLLSDEECEALLKSAENKYERIDDTSGTSNYLESSMASENQGVPTAIDVDQTMLWKGSVGGKTFKVSTYSAVKNAWRFPLNTSVYKDIDERISQVTGFPPEHFSDFQINKYVKGSLYGPHYDMNPANGIMATITVFLNDVPIEQGGEFVYPKTQNESGADGGDAVVIRPTKGLAVVHHNTDDRYNFDQSSVNQELSLNGGVKYIAKKYIYLNPQPNSMRIVLPMLAMPFGGKLPKVFSKLQNTLIDSFGFESGCNYFDKIINLIPILILVGIAQFVTNFVQSKLKGSGGENASGENDSSGKAKSKKRRSKKKSD